MEVAVNQVLARETLRLPLSGFISSYWYAKDICCDDLYAAICCDDKAYNYAIGMLRLLLSYAIGYIC